MVRWVLVRIVALLAVAACSDRKRPVLGEDRELGGYYIPAVCAQETRDVPGGPIYELRLSLPMTVWIDSGKGIALPHLQIPTISCSKGRGDWDCHDATIVAVPALPSGPPELMLELGTFSAFVREPPTTRTNLEAEIPHWLENYSPSPALEAVGRAKVDALLAQLPEDAVSFGTEHGTLVMSKRAGRAWYLDLDTVVAYGEGPCRSSIEVWRAMVKRP